MLEPLNSAVGFPQDLKNIYVYWDFTPQRVWVLRDFMTHIKPGMVFCLRLLGFGHDPAAPPSIEREVLLDKLEGHGGYYFHNIKPSLNYRFELGGKDPEGLFVPFARTVMIHLLPTQRHGSPVLRLPLTLQSEWNGYHENQPSSGIYPSERNGHTEP